MLTGSHTIKIYYQDARQFRVSIPQPESEIDLIRNGTTAWLWNSTENSVTKFDLPANGKGKVAHLKSELPSTPLTPQQAANELLKAVGKTTVVSVEANVMVAGEPSYQLVLAPKDDRSLVGKVTIAIDAKYGVPLRVQVFAKGAAEPGVPVRLHGDPVHRPGRGQLRLHPAARRDRQRRERQRRQREVGRRQRVGRQRLRQLRHQLAHGRGTPAAGSHAGHRRAA